MINREVTCVAEGVEKVGLWNLIMTRCEPSGNQANRYVRVSGSGWGSVVDGAPVLCASTATGA